MVGIIAGSTLLALTLASAASSNWQQQWQQHYISIVDHISTSIIIGKHHCWYCHWH